MANLSLDDLGGVRDSVVGDVGIRYPPKPWQRPSPEVQAVASHRPDHTSTQGQYPHPATRSRYLAHAGEIAKNEGPTQPHTSRRPSLPAELNFSGYGQAPVRRAVDVLAIDGARGRCETPARIRPSVEKSRRFSWLSECIGVSCRV